MSKSQEVVFERLLKRFEEDILENVKSEKSSGKLDEEGRCRLQFRNDILNLMKNNLDIPQQMQLVMRMANKLYDAHEVTLAKECFSNVLEHCHEVPGVESTLLRIQAMHGIASCEYELLYATNYFYIAPKALSQALTTTANLVSTLELLMEFPAAAREDYAWLVLNSCKLIYRIVKPLLWLNCGKYITETLLFCSLCMDAVINLCTARHLKFKLKLISTALSALFTYGTMDEVNAVIYYVSSNVSQLRAREELDPPIPDTINEQLQAAEYDIAVYKAVLAFWRDPDGFSLASIAPPSHSNIPKIPSTFTESVILEISRIQQLTCGNPNEAWKKRSTAVLNLLSSYVSSSESSEPEISQECLLDMAIVAMFDVVDMDIEPILDLIFSRLEENKTDVTIYLQLLQHLKAYVKSNTLNNALVLVSTISIIVQSDVMETRIGLLRRVCLSAFSKVVYPSLQRCLTSSVNDSSSIIDELLPSLSTITSTLELVGLEDPLLVANLSLIVAHMLILKLDYREAIVVLTKALYDMDRYRSSRVDLHLHCPEDSRDILALLHDSVSTTPTPTEWFHSLKRLGANAFAGFGLFGSSSSVSQYDQSVANTNTDIVLLLLRTELQYNITNHSLKLQAKAGKPAATVGGDATVTINIVEQENLIENVEKLPCVVSLRASIAKSNYTRALLYMMMTNFEANAQHRQAYFLKTLECIAEAECGEAALLKQQLLTKTATPHPPLILARSSEFFYVCPVASSGSTSVHHYQIYGREQGSGTDVSHTSDELGGCDTLVLAHQLQTPAFAAVKITSVRYGEKYCFASGAYSHSNKLVSVSPSTIGVEAVNPLPTLQLYAYLCLSAAKLKHMKVARQAALVVVNYFLLQSPVSDAVTIGRNTIFAAPEFYLNEIALQQATPLMLCLFLKCFLILDGGDTADELNFDIDNVQIHWQRRKLQHVELIASVNRLARVITVAMRLCSHEMIVRLACVFYNAISTVMQYDMVQMAQFLQNPLLVYLTALQSINRNNWCRIDHILYTRFMLYAVQCGIISGNNGVIVPVLRQFWVDELDSSLTGEKISYDTLDLYMSTIIGVKSYSGVLQSPELRTQQKELLSIGAVEELWQSSTALRHLQLRGTIEDVLNASDSSPEVQVLRQALEAPPVTTSVFLSALLCCVDELTKTGNLSSIPTLLSNYPLHISSLCDSVAAKCKEWCVSTAILREEESESPREMEREITLVEEQQQLRCLAWFVYLYVTSQFAENKRNDFPQKDIGCYAMISYDDLARMQAEPIAESGEVLDEVPAAEEATATETSAENAPVPVLDNVSYVRHLLFAAVSLIDSQCPLSATDVFSCLWNYIVNVWQHPQAFADEFNVLKKELTSAMLALVQLMEAQTSFDSEEENFASPNNTLMSRYPRDVKQMLFSLKDIFVYLIKVLGVLKQWDELVDSGLRVLDVYIYNASSYCKFIADQIIPVMNFAQDELTQVADNKVVKKQQDLDNYIAAYEEIQAKKRKKKLRVARAEKSEDELKFEADKAKLLSRLHQLQSIHESCVERRDSISKKEKRVESLCSTGAQLLSKVRANRNSFVAKLDAVIANKRVSYVELLQIRENNEKYEEICEQFDVVAQFVREKKERGLLLQCLNEFGDFYLVFGATDQAQMSWRDAIDGLFNVLDAWRNWKELLDQEKVTQDDVVLQNIMLAVMVLGKLSRHCSDMNFDLKSTYCEMAAKLCEFPYLEGVGHPQTLPGFATYECLEVGGRNSVDFRFDVLSSTVLDSAFDEVVLVLGRVKCHLQALPVIVLHEHFHSYYTRRVDAWLSARLRRIEYLSHLHFFSEAVSMLTGVPTQMKRIYRHIFASPLQHVPGQEYTLAQLDASENGCQYYGFPPYFNHLPPEDEKNQASIAWLATCYDQIRITLNDFVVYLPVPVKTEEELEAERIRAAEIAAAKEAEKAKNKKKAKEVEEAPPEEPPVPTKPLIEAHQHIQLRLVVALMLTEMASLDERLSVPHGEALHQLRTTANAAAIGILEEITESPNWTNTIWLSQYLASNVLLLRLLLQSRSYTAARAMTLALLKQLSECPNQDNTHIKNTLCQFWLELRFYLILVGLHQGRFKECISINEKILVEICKLRYTHWTRRFELLHASLLFKSGELQQSRDVLASLIENYKSNSVIDEDYIRALALYASVLRSLAINVTYERAKALLREAMSSLKTSYVAAMRLSEFYGFLGADINATYDGISCNAMSHHRMPPALHNLTSIYENHPDLTGKLISKNKTRLGPIDTSSVYAKSVFINIYLRPVRSLASISSSYVQLLDELRMASILDTDDEEVSPSKLLKDEIYIAENALKVGICVQMATHVIGAGTSICGLPQSLCKEQSSDHCWQGSHCINII